MSNSVTNFGRNGLHDWIIQRATAVILAVYFFVVMAFFICNPDLEYKALHCFFSSNAMKIGTIISLLSIAAHAWIGLWTFATDYLIKDGHLLGSVPTWFRLAFLLFVVLVLLASVLWGTLIIWGL